jgi:hypothetical protein
MNKQRKWQRTNKQDVNILELKSCDTCKYCTVNQLGDHFCKFRKEVVKVLKKKCKFYLKG